MNSLTGNLQRFGFERTSKAQSLQEIIEEMGEASTDEAANHRHLMYNQVRLAR